MATVARSQGVPDSQLATKVVSPAMLAWRRFRRHKLAVASMVVLAGLVAFLLFGGLLFARGVCTGTGTYMSGEAYANCNDTQLRLQPPSATHPFGTDTVGRDILARVIYGGQISLLIGLLAAMSAVGIGAVVGIVSGYYRGWVDSGLMRFTEAMLSVPQLFLLLLAAKFFAGGVGAWQGFGREFSGSIVVIILVMGLTGWMSAARVVRATTLSVKEREFIVAARTIGASNMRIIVRHILPNTMTPIIVAVTLAVAGAILAEAYISYLGLGVRAPSASWGNMLEGAYRYLERAPWLWIFPGLAILLTVLSINFVGDGLRDALDPRHRYG